MALHLAWRMRQLKKRLLNLFIRFLDRDALRREYPHVDCQGVDLALVPHPYSGHLYKTVGCSPDFLRYAPPAEAQPQGFVSILKDAEVVGKYGVVVDVNGRVVLESTIFQREFFNKTDDETAVLGRRWAKATEVNEVVVPLGNYLCYNYFHWMSETLPRMFLIEELQQRGEMPPYKILLPKGAPASIPASLERLFGVRPEQIIWWEGGRLRCPAVYLPSFLHIRPQGAPHHIYARGIFPQLRQKALAQLSIPSTRFSRRVLVSREGYPQRQILNEAALLEALKPWGFVAYRLEKLNFEEQIALFAHAECIVAPHGAAITNIIFTQHARLIELFPSNRLYKDTYTFFQIAQTVETEYVLMEVPCQHPKQHLELGADLLDSVRAQVAAWLPQG